MLSFSFILIFINKKPNNTNEHINYKKNTLKTYISSKLYLKRELQIVSYRTLVCVEVHMKMFFPYYIVKLLEKDSWNNCTFARILLKLHKLTGWFIILCMNVVQLHKHFWNCCLTDFILCFLSLPLRKGRMLVLSSKFNIEQGDFTDWMSFQSSRLTEEISPHPTALSSNT